MEQQISRPTAHTTIPSKQTLGHTSQGFDFHTVIHDSDQVCANAADTPGVHLHHRLPHLLSPEELKELHPRKQLRPYYPPMPQDLTPQQEEEETATGSCATAVERTG